MDPIDTRLLTRLFETGMDLSLTPFHESAKALGTDEADVLLRIQRLKEKGWIRALEPVFDLNGLGYRSVLASMEVNPAKCGMALPRVSEHPGVRMVIERKHRFNVWFSLLLPAEEDFEAHVEKLHELAEARTSLLLPALKLYKPLRPLQPSKGGALAEDRIAVIRALQGGFPLTDRPFSKIASAAQIAEPDFFRIMGQLKKEGILRGIRALRPVKEAKKEYLLMGWRVPEEKRDEIGRRLASFDKIKSCVERPSYADLPYSLYASVAGTRDRVPVQIGREIAGKIGEWPFAVLSCEKVVKDVPVRFFSEQLQAWREEVGLRQKRTAPDKTQKLMKRQWQGLAGESADARWN